MPKLKIISDGTTQGAKLINTETGEDLVKTLPIEYMAWSISADSVGKAIITVNLIAIEAEGILFEPDNKPLDS